MPANKYPAANWNSVIVAMPAGMPVDWFNLLLVPTAVARYGLGSCVLEYTRVLVPGTCVYTAVYGCTYTRVLLRACGIRKQRYIPLVGTRNFSS